MRSHFENEEYEINAGVLTDNEQWGVSVCIRKNGSDIGLGFHFSVFIGVLQLYLPFVIIGIHTPFYCDPS
jgi:hypothetical protein